VSRRQGHITERSPGHWLIRYSRGTDPATGKRHRANVTFRGDRKSAEKELRRLQKAIDDGAHVDPSRITVRDWLAQWLDTIRPEVAPKTHERYGELVRHFLAPALGNLQLGKLAPVHIQQCYTELAEGGRRDGKPGGLSPRTRRQIHAVLSSALSRAVELQLLARNPAEVFRKRQPRIERKEMVALTVEQSQRLLAALRHSRVYWPVLLALSTGMRRGEILALRWRNIDLDRGSLRVIESLEQTKAGLRFKPPKNGRTRVITLPAFVVDELRRLRREQAEELLVLGSPQDDATVVCARADGLPLQPRSLTHEFSVLMAHIKDVPPVRFHDLRHSHATQLLAAGLHPKVAQERLGHSTITTTMDIYSHVTAQVHEDAAARIDAAYNGVDRRAQH
jgi:integrase